MLPIHMININTAVKKRRHTDLIAGNAEEKNYCLETIYARANITPCLVTNLTSLEL